MKLNPTISRYRCLLILCGLLLAPSVHAQRLKVVIGGAEFRPYPMAVPALRVVGQDESAESKKIARDLTSILQLDVNLARSLEFISPQTYLAPHREPITSPKYINWINIGASGLIRGTVENLGPKIRLSLRFYDVVGQRELLSKSYDVAVRHGSWAIHRFLDQVVKNLTGELGIFSTQIAYVKRTAKGKSVYICDMDGRNERRITNPSTLSLLPAWDRTGATLLFTSYLRNNPDLYRINLSDGKLEWLSSKRGLNTGAAMSPDGRKIALTLSIDGNTEIYLMDSDGKNLTRLTDSWGQDVSPTWSPDGQKIAFVSSRSGNPHIYTMNADGSNPTRLTFRGNYNQEPDWSPRPDGKIAFTARDERLQYDIFLIDPITRDITRLTQDHGNNESPSFSPDGLHITFTSTRAPHYGKKLYIMDVDGKNQNRISRHNGEYETPSWGPRVGYALTQAQ